MPTNLASRRRAASNATDPFTYCRRHGILVTRVAGEHRWLTGLFLGEVFVALNASLTGRMARTALAEALLAHPLVGVQVSRR